MEQTSRVRLRQRAAHEGAHLDWRAALADWRVRHRWRRPRVRRRDVPDRTRAVSPASRRRPWFSRRPAGPGHATRADDRRHTSARRGIGRRARRLHERLADLRPLIEADSAGGRARMPAIMTRRLAVAAGLMVVAAAL